MRLRLLPLALFAALALVAVAGAGTASAKSCSPAKYPGDGYFTSLKVKGGATCSAGRTVQKHHYECRIDNGGKDGRCKKKVDGYNCNETRNRISTEINARVKCKKSGRTIKFTYQQNL